jgi:hypothetical protein
MSPNQKLCLAPAQLYIALQLDLAVRGFCDVLEKVFHEFDRLPWRRLEAGLLTSQGLFFRTTKPELANEFEKRGYRKHYAKKLAYELIARHEDMLAVNPEFKLEKSRQRMRGDWGKRWTKPAAGRPATKYRVVKSSEFTFPEQIEPLAFTICTISGSARRLFKLLLGFMFTSPKAKAFAVEFFVEGVRRMCEAKGIAFEESQVRREVEGGFQEISAQREEIEKTVDEVFDEELLPIQEAARHYLEVEA